MDCVDNIRIIAVFGDKDHGSTSVVDTFLVKAKETLLERGPCMEPFCTPVYYQFNAGNFHEGIAYGDTYNREDEHLIYLQHSDYWNLSDTLETSRVLRTVDGVITVVGLTQGWSLTAHNVVRQAMDERVRPILVLNKLDIALLDLELSGEHIYQHMLCIIDEMNRIIEAHRYGEEHWLVDPVAGNVIVASAQDQWGFTLDTFAKKYESKFHIPSKKVVEKLWGDWVFVAGNDTGPAKWVKSPTVNANNGVDKETGAERSFISLVMKPIMSLCHAVMSKAVTKKGVLQAYRLAEQVGVCIPEAERASLTGKTLLRRILSSWLPLIDVCLEVATIHLPSPRVAQTYRVDVMYDGPLDDGVAAAVRTSDPDERAPLLMYVSRTLYRDDGLFVAVGRVFSGRVRRGYEYSIMGPRFQSGCKRDFFRIVLSEVVALNGCYCDQTKSMSAGNLCGIVGTSRYLHSAGTISSCGQSGFPIRNTKITGPPTVLVSMDVANSSHLPTFVSALRRVGRSRPGVEVAGEDTGQYLLRANSMDTLWLELRDLKEKYARGLDYTVSEPMVSYRESILAASDEVSVQSADEEVCLHFQACPLSSDICTAFDLGKAGPFMSQDQRQQVLRGWEWGDESSSVGTVWCFGGDDIGPNILTETVINFPFLNDIRDYVVPGFQWSCEEGPLCGEPVRGVQLNLTQVEKVPHRLQRYRAKIMQASRDASYRAMLRATPHLLQPFNLLIISCHRDAKEVVENIISSQKGVLLDEVPHFSYRVSAEIVCIRAQVAVTAYIEVSSLIKREVSSASLEVQFSHWQPLIEVSDTRPYSFLEDNLLSQTIRDLRARKFLDPDLASLEKHIGQSSMMMGKRAW